MRHHLERLTALLAVACLCPALHAHPKSMSSTRVHVHGDVLETTLRCQVLSLQEELNGLDENGDGAVDPAEIERQRQRILAYIDEHSRFIAGSDEDLQGGTALAPQSTTLAHAPAGTVLDIPEVSGVIDIERRYRAGAPIDSVVVESRLFRNTSPGHIDLLAVDWNGRKTEHHALRSTRPRVRIDGSSRSVFLVFLDLGFRHILGGWDHLAFLAALILSAARLRSLLGLVTAFTVAHSLTLALATYDVVDLSAHMQLVEAIIALSIAYVATDTLVAWKRTRTRWIEAFIFGLIHGLGFASFLDQSLVMEPSRWQALLSFNLGVEAGQILVAIAAVALLRLTQGRRAEDDKAIARRSVRFAGSAVIAAAGLWWFVERI